MPIRFVCENCDARLSVSTRKAGMQAKCPKCHVAITVPKSDQSQGQFDLAVRSPVAGQDVGQRDSDDDPFAQFTVYDVESELVYDTGDEPAGTVAAGGAVDPNKLAISRNVLYAQGALLGFVSLISFAIGVLVGLGASNESDGEGDVPQPCVITGTVVLRDDEGEANADVGAVAIVVPRDVRPEQKAEIIGLRPQDPDPVEGHLGLLSITSIGGDYTRTDDEGRFELRVPDRGSYFLLVISTRAGRQEDDPSKTVLAQIGRFFQLTPNLLEGHAYRWQEESVRRDRELKIVFP